LAIALGILVVATSSCGKDAEGLFDPIGAPSTDGGAGTETECMPGEDAAVDETVDAPAEIPSDSASDVEGQGDTRDARVDGGASSDGCVASTEICDGLDDNCNGAIDEGTACPVGCIGWARQSAGYMFCFSDAMHKAWTQAQNDCVAQGMHLVRVDDAAENRWINDSAVNFGFLEQIWLGGVYVPTVSQWQWTDGTPFWTSGSRGQPVNGRFSNWTAGEPSNDGIDGCADKLFGDTEVWEDRPCSVQFAFLCER
jgi:hypothetical protein